MPPRSSVSVLSHTNTMHSIGSQISSKMRTIAHYGQPTIEIALNDTDGPRQVITSYSTMDTLQGTVTITAPHDTRFEDIDIAFVGTSKVFVDKLTTTPTMTGRTEATHRFLLLRQPIDEMDFPAPRIFEAGRKYQFPFTFTIPTQLLPRACSHIVASDQVRQAHLQLPPSLGEPELSGHGATLLDDFAPEMSKITYAIKVRIAHCRGSEGISILAEKSKKVRVKPVFEEQPPVNIDNNDEYRSKQEKSVRRRLFEGKLGTVTAKTVQPKPFVIPGARSTDNKPITTMSKLVLRFDPEEENNMPAKLSTLGTRIKATTHYASCPRRAWPSRAGLGYDLTHGIYTDTIPLSSLCVASAQWEKHDANSNPAPESVLRRDSGISDCSAVGESDKAFAAGILSPSKKYKKGIFYTAQILVPITLPLNKSFIPTFHSCLISRVYTLYLNLSSQGGTGFHLKVPVQICAQGSESGNENARARTAEESALRETNELLNPRSFVRGGLYGIREPDVDSAREELPPAYGAFAPPEARYNRRPSAEVPPVA